MYVDVISLLVIPVWHPRFPLDSIKDLTEAEGSKEREGRERRGKDTMSGGGIGGGVL